MSYQSTPSKRWSAIWPKNDNNLKGTYMQRCPIFYRPEMSAQTASYFASSDKPARLVANWLRTGAIVPADIHSFEPAHRQDLYLAHSQSYVNGVLNLFDDNGFGNNDAAIARSLPYTTGSMMAAAQHVAEHGGFACSPTSGFHHAGFAEGSGFCTFNGLAVTALALAHEGVKVGILDCDAHYGDGTDEIIKVRHAVDKIEHHSMGAVFPTGQRAKRFFGWLDNAIDQLQGCDVVLYQAGADPYIHDPLGGQLTRKELLLRDAMVFAGLKNVAWNLAGGYSNPTTVDAIHTTTLRAAKGTENED